MMTGWRDGGLTTGTFVLFFLARRVVRVSVVCSKLLEIYEGAFFFRTTTTANSDTTTTTNRYRDHHSHHYDCDSQVGPVVGKEAMVSGHTATIAALRKTGNKVPK